MSNKYDYDAVIIGAGISGLVCGCYLAKAGMKVLIVEKNAKPGGYCTSFTRGGFHFDACVQSLSSLRDDGNIRTALKELEIESRLGFKRYDPSDIIVTPDLKIHLWNDLDKTIQEFQHYFPKEANRTNEFFSYLKNIEGISFSALRSITFQDLLDKYFTDNNLKSIFSFLLLSNSGLPANKISAFAGAVVCKDFILDGGYYPDGSIQSFPDILMERFIEYGGEILLPCRVQRISVENNKAVGITLKKEKYLSSEFVISGCDATQTFLSLLGPGSMDDETTSLLSKMTTSLSSFILYLGTDGRITDVPLDSLVLFLPHYDIDALYHLTANGPVDQIDWFTVRVSSGKKRVLMHVNVPFQSDVYWNENKKRLIDVFISKMETIIPELSSHILFKDAATPKTLQKWTLNHRGAAFGWDWTPAQFALKGLSQITSIRNLYLTGHWTTLAQGVSGVTYLGRRTAKFILNRKDSLS
ncbi:MAG: NAD(P)/FAD-dependent oxidoreductase [Nitrospirae bacterium]|nr:NAD(P)/FAD-dependent oxidoreductase [Nitrospirota bacterium]